MKPTGLIFISVIFITGAFGQKSYLSLEYIDVSAASEEEFVNLEKSIAPVFRQLVEDGVIQDRAVLRLWYPGQQVAGYDYLAITAYSDFSGLENASTDLLIKARTNSTGELIDRYLSLYSLSKREITEVWRDFLEAKKIEDGDLVTHFEEGHYLHWQYLKVMEDQWDNYTQLEAETWMPIHKANIEKGRLQYWALFGYWFVQRNIDYDLMSVFVYPEFSFLKDKFYNQDTWVEVHGEEAPDQIFNDTFAFRKDVHSEVWKVASVLRK